MIESNPKLEAARKAMEWVNSGQIIGLGTGSTANFFIEELGNKIKHDNLKVTVTSSSFSSTLLARKLNIPISTFESIGNIDLYVDGADEVDPEKNLIKGRGASMVQEKILAASSDVFLVIVDSSKLVNKLGAKARVPVEVLPCARIPASRSLASMGGEPELRMAVKKDGPVITDQGNFILDVKFSPDAGLPSLDTAINNIPGVLGHGIFTNLATKIIVGEKTGTRVIE
ncbi:ribose-5-phosphate isomerase RpiA [Fibrobacterota bacterium]